VIIVDFTFEPFMKMHEVADVSKTLTWIDHHITSFQEYVKHPFPCMGLRRIGTAACELTWNYYFPDKPVPHGLKLIASWDVHDLEYSDDIVPLQYGARAIKDLYDPTNALWAKGIFDYPAFVNKIIKEGKIILGYVEAEHAKIMKLYSFEGNFLGHRAIMVNRGSMNSKAFESVYDPKNHDIMLAFARTPYGDWSVSIYTDKDDIDVSQIAKEQGGGGHKQAAGFQTKHLWFLE
ncbi:MAG: hypothetical protein GWN62_18565, partial [Aliifodinibius sp.]|nr:hypothetical protein [Fodinibius sp.]